MLDKRNYKLKTLVQAGGMDSAWVLIWILPLTCYITLSQLSPFSGFQFSLK